jgi:hypothetical protein
MSALETHADTVPGSPLPFADQVRLSALELKALAPYPDILDEFDRSLRKRTRFWQPVMDVLFREFDKSPSEALTRVLAGWYTMVHLSAPLDQVVDRDPMSEAWRRLGSGGAFELVLRCKDECLMRPLEAATSESLPAISRATLALASSALTTTIGEFLDIAGGAAIDGSSPPEKIATFYDHLVGWKTAEIYRCFFRCVALALEATDEQRRTLEDFGAHAGYAVQVLDDAGGVWGGGDDLDKQPAKMTFPTAYGLTANHQRRDELLDVLLTPAPRRDQARAREILESIDTLGFLEFLIAERRDRSAEVLKHTFGAAMVDELMAWYERYFRREL